MSREEDAKDLAVHNESIDYRDVKNYNDVGDTEAAGYINPNIVITPEENRRLRNRILKRQVLSSRVSNLQHSILPILCVAYITQGLDKGTLGSASIMGWQADVGAVGQDYALTGTLLYVGIAAGEPVSNQLIRFLPVSKMLGGGMLIWTALTFGLAFSLKIPQIFAIRTLLGFFEAVFHPCLVGTTVQWFLKSEQLFLITVWQGMFAMANLIASLLAFAFYQINGATGTRSHGLYPWQWMTVCIGLISFCASLVVLFFMPDSPSKARWASEEDKVKFIERVRANDQGIKQPIFRRTQALEAVRDIIPWLLVLMVTLQTLIVGGINTFNNLLINRAFGFTVSQSQLLGIPLAFFQAFLFLTIAFLVSKTGQTIYCMIGYCAINVAGTIVLITVTPGSNTRGGLLVSFYLMQCLSALNPCMWSLLARNIAGSSKKSIAYAMFFAASAIGNIIAPQIFQAAWAPRYIPGLYIHLGIYAAFIIDLLIIRTIFVRRNRTRDAAMSENLHAHAFEDLSDLENPEFRYSY